MSTLSNKKLHDIAEKLCQDVTKAFSPSSIFPAWQSVYDFAKAIQKEIENTPEWQLQEELNKKQSELGKALLGIPPSSINFEVDRSRYYQDADPKFDVTITINPIDIVPRLANGRNAKSIESEFPRKMETSGLGSRTIIGKVTVKF